MPPLWGIHPVPKSSQFPNCPVTTTFPAASTATALPASVHPPATFDHRCAPLGEYLVTKMAWPNGLVSVPPPRSTVWRKDPVTTALPLASTATPLPETAPVALSACLDQIWAPVAEYFAMKMSF